jgi:hypothetical protein
MLDTEIVAVCCENYSKHIDTLCGDTAEVLTGIGWVSCYCDFYSFEVEEWEGAGSVVQGVSSLLWGKQKITFSEDAHFLPARPSVQEVGRRQGRGLGSEEGKMVGSGPLGRRWEFGLSFVFGGEQYDEILIALGGLRLGEKFEFEI